MKITETGFAANVELPCRIFTGADKMVVYSGVALSIESGRLSLNLGNLFGAWEPAVGEDVGLELELPVNVESAKAKYLSVRAKVVAMDQKPDGTKVLELAFRKPSFKDRMADPKSKRRAVQKSAVNGWEM